MTNQEQIDSAKNLVKTILEKYLIKKVFTDDNSIHPDETQFIFFRCDCDKLINSLKEIYGQTNALIASLSQELEKTRAAFRKRRNLLERVKKELEEGTALVTSSTPSVEKRPYSAIKRKCLVVEGLGREVLTACVRQFCMIKNCECVDAAGTFESYIECLEKNGVISQANKDTLSRACQFLDLAVRIGPHNDRHAAEDLLNQIVALIQSNR
jgi:hypothetical protein